MAWSNSRWFIFAIRDALTNTAAIDLTLDTHKAALYDNDITPDQDVTAANSAYNVDQWAIAGNEVSDGTEWDAGGEPITGTDLDDDDVTGTIEWDATNTPSGGTSATLAAVFGCLNYAEALASPVANQGLAFSYFGGTNDVTNGTFTIIWADAGIANIDVTP